eukprot:scaffold429_cov114-Cylindrotheca_fusiformis.AAC.3
MSKQMITTFFPAVNEALNSNRIPLGSFFLNDLLFPDATAEACPEITLSVSTQHHDSIIRQPVLCLCAVGGAMVGLVGAYKLALLKSPSLTKLWVVSFFSFGVMNLSAIWLHCLLPAPSQYDKDSPLISYPEAYPMLWMIDTYTTGVAATALLVASLSTNEQRRQSPQSNNDKAQWNNLFGVLQGIGVACLASFLVSLLVWMLEGVGSTFLASFLLHTGRGKKVDMNLNIRHTYPLELWYLVPPFLATVPVIQLLFGPILVRQASTQVIEFFPEWRRRPDASTTERATASKRRAWNLGHTLFVTGLLLSTFIGIGLDRFWCWAIHSRPGGGGLTFFLWDLLTSNTLVFLGCDLAFGGILFWLLTIDDYQRC